MKLDDVRIPRKLAIGFGATLILITVLCIFSIISSLVVRNDANYVKTQSIPKLNAASRIATDILELTKSFGTMPFLPREVYEAEKARVSDLRKDYKEAMAILEKLAESEDEKRAIQRFKGALLEAAEKNNSIMKLAEEGKREEAMTLYVEDTMAATRKFVDGALHILDDQQKRIQARADELYAVSRRNLFLSVGLGLASILIGILFSVKISKGISKPVNEAISHMKRMAEGDFSLHFLREYLDRKDEIGDMARALDAINVNVRKAVENVVDSIHSLTSAATELSAIAEEMSRTAESSSSRASSVATAAEEMSQSVVDVARNTASIAETANKERNAAHDGKRIVENSINEVKEIAKTVARSAEFVRSLGERSIQIGEIVNTITDIADQTSLLALNAAIEAARAGDQGRGFAVVADEVKKLAERTAKATSEISEMIKAIQDEVNNAVRSMEDATKKVETGVDLSTKAGDALKEIVRGSDELQLMLQQIATATEQMSTSSEQISKEIIDIANAARDTTQSAQDTAQSAVTLSNLATTLQNAVKFFRLSEERRSA